VTDSGFVYDGIETVLLAEFPEFGGRMEDTFGSYYDLKSETPEAYPVFESVFKEFVFETLANHTEPMLARIFPFLERMASSQDRNVLDLLGIAILEPLVCDAKALDQASKYFGPRTRALAFEEVQRPGLQQDLPTVEPSKNDN
jgi:hypothetical protein